MSTAVSTASPISSTAFITHSRFIVDKASRPPRPTLLSDSPLHQSSGTSLSKSTRTTSQSHSTHTTPQPSNSNIPDNGTASSRNNRIILPICILLTLITVLGAIFFWRWRRARKRQRDLGLGRSTKSKLNPFPLERLVMDDSEQPATGLRPRTEKELPPIPGSNSSVIIIQAPRTKRGRNDKPLPPVPIGTRTRAEDGEAESQSTSHEPQLERQLMTLVQRFEALEATLHIHNPSPGLGPDSGLHQPQLGVIEFEDRPPPEYASEPDIDRDSHVHGRGPRKMRD